MKTFNSVTERYDRRRYSDKDHINIYFTDLKVKKIL